MKKFEHKPIRLSKDQEEKLLEMTKKCFTEYNSVWIERFDADNIFFVLTNLENDIIRGGQISIGGHKFHWFELMMFLADRIEDVLGEMNMFNRYPIEKNEEQHIVDFFYERLETNREYIEIV